MMKKILDWNLSCNVFVVLCSRKFLVVCFCVLVFVVFFVVIIGFGVFC